MTNEIKTTNRVALGKVPKRTRKASITSKDPQHPPTDMRCDLPVTVTRQTDNPGNRNRPYLAALLALDVGCSVLFDGMKPDKRGGARASGAGNSIQRAQDITGDVFTALVVPDGIRVWRFPGDMREVIRWARKSPGKIADGDPFTMETYRALKAAMPHKSRTGTIPKKGRHAGKEVTLSIPLNRKPV